MKFSFLPYQKKINNEIFFDLSVISGFWILMVVFVNAYGEFPIIDDFSYLDTLKRLYHKGTYIPHYYTSMTLVSHVYLGYFYSLLVGFSIEKLRILIAIYSLIGLVFTYLISRELKISRKLRYFICLLLATNPAFLQCSFTFMTDVPFFCFSMVSIYFYLKTLTQFSYKNWLVATLFCLIAILTRQVGFFIPIAFCIVLTLKNSFNLRFILIGFITILISVIVYISYVYWIEIANIKPSFFNNQAITHELNIIELIVYFTKNLISNSLVISLYLALFTFPILIIFSKKILDQLNIKIVLLSILFSICVFLIIYLILGRLLPFCAASTIVSHKIMGPFEGFQNHQIEKNPFYQYFLSIISILSLSLIVAFFVKVVKPPFNKISISSNQIFIFILWLIYTIPFLFTTIFERYFFISIVLVSLIIASSLGNYSIKNNFKFFVIGVIYLLIISINSIILTRDFISYSRTRQEIIQKLIRNKVNKNEIAGGFAYYGNNFSEKEFREFIFKGESVFNNKLKYFIVLFPEKEMKILSTHPFKSIYGMGNNKIYVCQKK